MNLARPNFILIGSAERNVGKTEFACKLIEHQAAEHAVIGVKVKLDSSLRETHRLSEEMDGPPGKDTARMLAAGAKKVYFLRIQPGHLAEGLAALLEAIPAPSCVVCESTSLRQVLEPGLFLVLKKAGSTEMKPSCEKVLGQVDRIIHFNGSGWDFPPGQITFKSASWEINL